ncbi:MAG: ATP synthase F1 subunit delta [Chloroflexi bacterium]|nr:ATP synthase F1 subunit delta [Chloroflexota bacterium]
MPKGISAKRHAQAVFQIALEGKQLERWQSDLETIAGTLKSPEITAMLESPKLRLEEKRRVLEAILPGITPAAMNLAYFLVAKNRLRILPDLLAEFRRLLNAYHGREVAEVVTAVPISDEDRDRIKKRLAALVGKELVLTLKVNPEIEGGLVARVGDKLVDGSIRTRLQDLRRSLAQT